jgi:hypothetical protein
MINIDPYIQKLEWLKWWMSLAIDVNALSIEFGMPNILSSTTKDDFPIGTFEQYCNYKQSLK